MYLREVFEDVHADKRDAPFTRAWIAPDDLHADSLYLAWHNAKRRGFLRRCLSVIEDFRRPTAERRA